MSPRDASRLGTHWKERKKKVEQEKSAGRVLKRHKTCWGLLLKRHPRLTVSGHRGETPKEDKLTTLESTKVNPLLSCRGPRLGPKKQKDRMNNQGGKHQDSWQPREVSCRFETPKELDRPGSDRRRARKKFGNERQENELDTNQQ